MDYRHLTQDERYQIQGLHRAGQTRRAIARELGRSPSTISRELRRNADGDRYSAWTAQRRSKERRRASARERIDPETWAAIEAKLRDDWSPEQICGRFRRKRLPVASHERIYQHVLADKHQGGSLWRHLRCGKRRRKRYGAARRRRFHDRRPISQRPKTVEGRHRVGHWEGDTMRFSGSRAVLVTVNERKSMYTRIARADRPTARKVTRGLLACLAPAGGCVQTLTLDNGSEFAEHDLVELALGIETYFADPYSAWQRGSNENMNGLIRQYLPRGTKLHQLIEAEIEAIEEKLNSRPRKKLGYRTPREVLLPALKRVALRS